MRLMMIAAVAAVATTAVAEEPDLDPICYAAMDRLSASAVAAIEAIPEIMARATKSIDDEGMQRIIRAGMAAAENPYGPEACLHILDMPEASVDAIGRAIAETIRRDLEPINSASPSR